MQALSGTGFSTATVTAVAPTPSSNPTTFSFTVTFGSSESPITYLTTDASGSTVSNLEAQFTNSATTAAASQTLTFTYDGPVADTTNPDATLTQNSNGSYTLTPTAGYQGVQFLEVTAITPVTGSFTLQVGSNTTASINFNSANLAGTAANMQTALQALGTGFSTATVTAVTPVPSLSPTDFSFIVTFPGSESLASVPSSSTFPFTVTNSAVAPASTQTLTFDETAPGNFLGFEFGRQPGLSRLRAGLYRCADGGAGGTEDRLDYRGQSDCHREHVRQ